MQNQTDRPLFCAFHCTSSPNPSRCSRNAYHLTRQQRHLQQKRSKCGVSDISYCLSLLYKYYPSAGDCHSFFPLLTDQDHFPVGDPTTRTDDALLGGNVGPPGRCVFLLVLGLCEVYQGQETWVMEMRIGEREEELRGGEPYFGLFKAMRGGKRRYHLFVLSNVVVTMSAKM